MNSQTQAERIAEEAKANMAEIKFWFESGDFAGVAVLGADNVFDCYSRSDIFLGRKSSLPGCRDLIIGY